MEVLTNREYNQMFTMHGTTMVFLVIMPLSAAFFNYLMPLQIGARDVAFPRMNALSLWCFVSGGIILNLSWFFTGGSPAIGWFGYAPLTDTRFAEVMGDMGPDFWIFSLQILGLASLLASFNFITTIINMRAPGMTMMRMPVFTWMTFAVSFLLAFSLSTHAQENVTVEKDQDGWKLLIDGEPFMVNGMNWDYFPRGTNYSYSLWNQPPEFIKNALDYEMGLLQNMGVNVIRVYSGMQPEWITYIYENYGIYTMLNHSFGRSRLSTIKIIPLILQEWWPLLNYPTQVQ